MAYPRTSLAGLAGIRTKRQIGETLEREAVGDRERRAGAARMFESLCQFVPIVALAGLQFGDALSFAAVPLLAMKTAMTLAAPQDRDRFEPGLRSMNRADGQP